MSSSQESQLAEDLRQLVEGRQFACDIEAIERRGRHQRRRGLAVRAAAGAGALGLGLAGVAMAGGTASTAAGPVPAQTVAYVRQQISAALTKPGYLVKAVYAVDSSGAMAVAWTDTATGDTMQQVGCGRGKTAYWQHYYYVDRVLYWRITQVYYGSRTWSSFEDHAPGPVAGPLPSPPPGGDYTSASDVRQMLGKGHAAIVGHPVVNGTYTIELSLRGDQDARSYVWADSRTYQVVRTELAFRRPGAFSTTTNYYWIPSTVAQAKLIDHPQIPAGFTQVPADGSIHAEFVYPKDC